MVLASTDHPIRTRFHGSIYLSRVIGSPKGKPSYAYSCWSRTCRRAARSLDTSLAREERLARNWGS